jgi:5-methylcytosine-specific restriction enzyme subunit McrC
MRTDIYLESSDRRIIVDTKYYKDALQEHYGSQSFHSGNLYQLYSYLKNDAASTPELVPAEGLLLYPQTGAALDAQFQIQQHRVKIATVDLSQPWKEVDARLRAIID